MTTKWIAALAATCGAAAAVALAPVEAAAQQAGVDPADAIESAARTITESDFFWRVGVIAHDSMGGRDTPSPGLERTAEWIASEFRRWGLRGGAEDGGFIQRYPLRSVVLDATGSSMTAGSATLALGEDFLPVAGAEASGTRVGSVALVSGAGRVSAGEAERVRDKHVVVVLREGAPGLDRSSFQLAVGLRNAGAASVSVALSPAEEDWTAMASQVLTASVAKGWGDDAGDGGQPFRPVLQMRSAALERLLAGRGVDLSALRARAGAPLRIDDVSGLEATLTLRVTTEDIAAPNVVGILEGSDPELRSEHIVFSGHMDHVGIGSPDQNGDSIFNGADDDASGTVAVMEVAEAMASLPSPPRRSMIFLLVSGEEKGLWGSEWYAEHPSVPVENLVANLNTDMVGRNWSDTIVAIGKEHSDLGATLERVNGAHPELRMTAIDDIWPEERFYFRSDHYNFARKGVPVLFFFNGTHEDYHGRDDEPDRIDAEKAARIARLVFYLGMDIADAAERPRWNPESYARIVSDGF